MDNTKHFKSQIFEIQIEINTSYTKIWEALERAGFKIEIYDSEICPFIRIEEKRVKLETKKED
jgi:hypothetical protein